MCNMEKNKYIYNTYVNTERGKSYMPFHRAQCQLAFNMFNFTLKMTYGVKLTWKYVNVVHVLYVAYLTFLNQRFQFNFYSNLFTDVTLCGLLNGIAKKTKCKLFNCLINKKKKKKIKSQNRHAWIITFIIENLLHFFIFSVLYLSYTK
jgi:hypothetical protein